MHHHDFESVFSRAQAVRKGGSGRRSLSCADGDGDGDGDGDLNSIQKLQATSSKSPLRVFEMQSSQQQEHKQDTSYTISPPKEIIATKAKYKHCNSASSPLTAIINKAGMDPIDTSEEREMQLVVRKTSSRRLSSATSVTYSSSSSSSSSCSSSSLASDGRREKDDPTNIGADNKIGTDEILARNMTISFKQETGKDVKSASSYLGIPFLDYLEKQVSKLNGENQCASPCCVAAMSTSCNDNTHPELSPLASQSAAVAEEKTIRCLKREVHGLHLTLDTLKKDSREWMLLKLILDDAREELNAVLEDQQLVRSIKTMNN